MAVNFWALLSVSLIYVTVSVPEPYCFDDGCFVEYFEIGSSIPPAFVCNTHRGLPTQKEKSIRVFHRL